MDVAGGAAGGVKRRHRLHAFVPAGRFPREGFLRHLVWLWAMLPVVPAQAETPSAPRLAAPSPDTVVCHLPAPPVPRVGRGLPPMLDEASRSAHSVIHPAGRAQDAGREVVLIADIDALGRVEHVAVERSSRLRGFDRSALRAVAGWRYRPALREGQPLPWRLRVTVGLDADGRVRY